MLTLEYEVALATRYVSEMYYRTVRDDEDSDLMVSYKKCYNLRSQIKYRRNQIANLETEEMWAKANKDPDQAEKFKRRIAVLQGEILVRCSEICMTYFHDFLGEDVEVVEREKNKLPKI